MTNATLENKTKEYSLDITKDHMKAMLRVTPGAVPRIEEILREVKSLGIVNGLTPPAKIMEFLDNANGSSITIASGRPQTKGTNGELNLRYQNNHPFRSHMTPDEWKTVTPIHTDELPVVKKGDIIATLIPPLRGEDGETVFGELLPGEWGLDARVQFCQNATVAANGTDYVALTDGVPSYNETHLRVSPLMIVENDITGESGPVKFDGILVVRGNVLDKAIVETTGDVIVEGGIVNSSLTCGGSLYAMQCISLCGKKGIKAKGAVYADNIEDSNVEADFGIIVRNDIKKSNVYTNGRIWAETIIEGRTVAGEGVDISIAGADRGAFTEVQAGYSYRMQKRYYETLDNIRFLQSNLSEIHQSETAGVPQKGADKQTANSQDRDKAFEIVVRIKKAQDDLARIMKLRETNRKARINVRKMALNGARFYIGEQSNFIVKETKAIQMHIDNETNRLVVSGPGAEPGGEPPRAPMRKILIIDDSPDIRRILKYIAERLGFLVVGEAEDGEAGIRMFEISKPDIVTCDVHMINVDGLSTLKAIRTIDSSAKVVMITAVTDKQKVMDCVAAGASDYMVKPIQPAKVAMVLMTALK